MKFHDDINEAFKPLKDFVSEFMEDKEANETISQYMYMFHDEEETHYKHFGSREYFRINHEGKARGKLENWRDWE
ncbi:hypothetical protein [Bacillus mesophilum]|uniref:Uncharacterized protein n=1 Tax=Bacillus mesophilum TaxID=1071718 RepID=A0A7V7RNX3_9BACI|nr:hypothetical protein [Bacillus mesophilum]KAB2334248.1 hypothetical protein F7732_09260 [Bacillus mesophilum]